MEASMMILRDLNANLTIYNEKVVTRNAELEKQADELSSQVFFEIKFSDHYENLAPMACFKLDFYSRSCSDSPFFTGKIVIWPKAKSSPS
jgi:hypothetical protein